MCAAQDVGSGRAASALPKKGENRMAENGPGEAVGPTPDIETGNGGFEVDLMGCAELVHMLT